jgi:hypothetical protein
VAVSEKGMSGRMQDQGLDLREFNALEGFLERNCNRHVPLWYLQRVKIWK